MTLNSTLLNNEVQYVPVIVRLSPSGKKWRDGKDAHDYGPTPRVLMLFLPLDAVNYGNIACWTPTDGHGEASLSYYEDTTPPHSRKREGEALVEQYHRLLESLKEPFRLEVRQRLPHDWRQVAWRR